MYTENRYGDEVCLCNPVVPPRLDQRQSVYPQNSREIKNPCMKQGFRQSHSFENGKANFPIFSAQLTVASPDPLLNKLMVN